MALRLFGHEGAPGDSQAFACERDALLVVAAPGGRLVDGDPPASALVVEVKRDAPRSEADAELPAPLAEPRLDFRVDRASALSYEVREGEYIQVIDVRGRQCSDFLAFHKQKLESGLERGMDGVTTRTLMGAAYPQPGLYAKFFDVDMDPLVQVVRDTVGRHDTFGLACTARYYEDMGYPGHVNCSDNFNGQVTPYGIAERAGWEAVNFFFNTHVDDDNVIVSDEPWSRPGDYVLMRAMTDLVCASSACPDDIDPANGWDITDIHVRVYSPENRFSTAIAHRVTPEAEPVLTKETAFHPRTSKLTESFVDYRGYWLPQCYNTEGAINQYWACREKAVIMDLSPLRKWEVLGPDAEALIQMAITRDARRLAVGQVVYTAVCNETGGMIDDATVFRLGDNNFRFIGGDPYTGVWLKELAERLDLKVWVKPSTDQLHNVAVQGPESREIMKKLVWTPPTQPGLEDLKWFRFLVGRIGGYQGIPVVVSRTGYTGELGYEVFCHPDDGPAVWDAIWEAGQPHGMTPLGLDALDMIRIEAGLIFAGLRVRRPGGPVRGRHRLHGEARQRGRLHRQGGADRALGAPAAQARGPRARGQRDGGARRRGVRGAPARWRGHERHAQPAAAQEHRALPDVGAVRGGGHRRRGRQARRPPEAHPRQGGRLPVLRPEEGTPAVVSEPNEFQFPISFTGPDGIGASPYDEYAEAERPDVGEDGQDPAVALRRTLGMFATGVTVITALKGDEVHGMTANAFMSVSLEPPLVLISVDRRTKMCSLLHEGMHYGVSVLCATQAELSDRFAGRSDQAEPRFQIVKETPLVDGALAHFVARVEKSYWGGDHSLFLGRVEYARQNPGTPLLFHGGRYEKLGA